MPKELKDYLHLLLGCECEVDFTRYISSKAVGEFEQKERVRCVFDSINRNKDIDQCWGVTVLNDKGFKYYVFDALAGFYTDFVHSTSIKPILRRLCDMTEEEDKECHNIMVGEYATKVKHRNIIHYEGEKIKYLLSKHIDAFELIEAGLAIDAKTLIKAA